MVLLKNHGDTLPFALEMGGGKGPTVAVIGQSVTDTERYLTGNYDGPLCQGKSQCFPTIAEEVSRLNAHGRTLNTSAVASASERESAVALATESDLVVLVVDNAKDGGGEGHDRYTVGLSEAQIQLCEAILKTNKTTVSWYVGGDGDDGDDGDGDGGGGALGYGDMCV